jgi:hypothetical protein
MFCYDTLASPNTIRLLKLLPSADASADLHCRLESTTLSAGIQYEALSYCWSTGDGDSTQSRTIICNGMAMSITRNCEMALRRLRLVDHMRSLWVDSVCINQAAGQERNHQVSLMGSIYSQATKVLVWLGPCSEATDPVTNTPLSTLCLDYMSRMAVELQESKAAHYKPDLDIYEDRWQHVSSPLYRDFLQQGADYVSTRNPSPLVQGFFDVANRLWWQRIWVVQEVALAREAIVFCGEDCAGISIV